MLTWIDQIPILILVMVRISAFFVAAPIFSMRGVPPHVKVGLAFFIALISFPIIADSVEIMVDFSFIILIMKEAIVGLALGFVAALILYTVQVAGAFIDFNMGFAIANVVDPQTGSQVPILGNFKYMLTLLFLLSLNGHHWLIEAVLRSYQMVPIDQLLVPIGSEGVAQFMTYTFTQMFLTAFQLALPIVGCLFLVDVALGILARTVPQVNVFVVGLPLKIFTGFVLVLVTLPIFFFLVQKVFSNMVETMGELLYLLGG